MRGYLVWALVLIPVCVYFVYVSLLSVTNTAPRK